MNYVALGVFEPAEHWKQFAPAKEVESAIFCSEIIEVSKYCDCQRSFQNSSAPGKTPKHRDVQAADLLGEQASSIFLNEVQSHHLPLPFTFIFTSNCTISFIKDSFVFYYVTRHIYPLYFLQNLAQVHYHIMQNSVYLHAIFLNIFIVGKILIWFQDPFGTSHHSFIVLWYIRKICKSCQCLQFH